MYSVFGEAHQIYLFFRILYIPQTDAGVGNLSFSIGIVDQIFVCLFVVRVFEVDMSMDCRKRPIKLAAFTAKPTLLGVGSSFF